ncbi:3-oxoacyl-[acyl-carrier protein] reductase [Leuconostoc inhae]|uniref:3-oxoacyl-[acyl-carrier protein] reductase n=2 Tax=Leuconostoc TaxID=1243 RepID=A0AAN2UFW8_9LACO|nr:MULTISPECIES: oxidoreductase [Leuconostoc]MBZ5957899.1 SDR family NAD(P)-dependent oxidoreductase [Leuconostoc gasicomitatum]MBZ5982102.1 SDR family NAD(P)-dependent oxidoreductase [Leuconostoc gasicomitatum]MBZ5987368.1 SDR family NAD(P)-dependent oxidoreductase [Leuconostoc gasicomitatum]MBZ5989443.1 SDR family NAD(P)-dependent oxidoreductase [Leuconostoc gasicomitatum]CUR63652.1 Short-chain oxidoreductase [Leuconostoc gasicomitatum KG16-1]
MAKKVILITGASSGIGMNAAIELAKQGHIVYGAARRLDKLNNLKEYGVIPVELDVTVKQQCVDVVTKIISEQHKIDVLYNNAGYGLYGAVEDIPIEDAKKQFDVNLFGLAQMTKLVLPYMREKNSGRIINTSSVGGKITTPLAAWYHASKFAVEGFSDTLRMEVKPFNIDIILIEPGLIKTDFYDITVKQIKKYSITGAYKKLAQADVNTLSNVSKGGLMGGSDPSVITKAVSKAVNDKKPKTRYLTGRLAKFGVFTKRILSDRIYDTMTLRQMANTKK